ncbi:fibronectin type III domain-containing protein [uncultured Flavobacterium sp.]|uniref:fibronectin type III domain-containing protein n=1 Tax=uncultured Flavobacterium sp. TaxID=165435 RepID=UPI0030ED6681
MKKITFKQMLPLIILLGFFSTTFVSIKAQCIRPTAFGTVVSNNSGLMQGITTCAYSTEEYSTVTGLTLGEDYVFAGQVGTTYGAGAHIYVTITDLSNTVIQHGISPQTVTNVAVAGVRIHLSDNAACAGTASCHNTSVLLITSCIVPSGLSSANVTTTTADISWTAPVNVPSSGYDYYYSTTNTAPIATTTPSGNIATGTTASLTGLNPSSQYYYWVRSNCGTETSSWSASGTFTTACVAITVPSIETFSTFIPACWSKANGGDLTAGPTTPGAGSWFADGFGNVGTTGAIKYNFFTSNTNDWFVSPQYVIPATGYEIKFDAAATQYASTSAPTTPWEADDVVEVLVSTGTANWTVLYTFDATNAPSNTGSINIIDISAFAGQTVKFAFRMVEGIDNGNADIEFFVDNFQVRLTPSCPEPNGLSVSAITTTSAQLAWMEMGSSTLWNVEYGPIGYTQGNGTPVNGVTTNPYTLNGLTPNTQYSFYVQADCTSSTSYWTGPFSFVTACVPFGSFTENFDTTPDGGLTNCWYKIVNSTDGFARVTIEDNVAFTEPNSAELYNSGDATANLLLITPNLTDLPNGTHRLKFRVSGGTNYTMEVGTMTDPTNAATYTSVEPFQAPNGFNEYIVNFSTVTTTDNYIAFKHGSTATYQTIKIDNVVWEPVPASVPPCASNIVATPNATCGNYATPFTWDATVGADGYRITIGTTSGGVDIVNNVDLGNVTSYSLTGNFNTTYYYTLTPYNAIGNAVSCTEQSFTTFATGCYCPSVPTSNDGSGITNVQLGTTAFPTTDVTYFSHTATTVNLSQSTNSNVQISFATGYTYNTYIWIDFNDNLTFETSEIVYTGESLAPNPTVLNASFIMPATAALGTHRMRIVTADFLPAADPCYSGSYGVTLDFSVNIVPAPACIPPTALTATGITSASANLGWTESATATVWDIEWGTSGFTPTGTPNITATTTNPHNLTGLTSNTVYSFYVRANCGGSAGESSWSGPFSFTTTCNATNVPYVMNFETAVVPALPNCTSQQNLGTGNSWATLNNPGFGFTTKTLRYNYSFSAPANVWFYTQGVNLTVGTTYAIAFDYGGSPFGSYVEKLKVAYGTSTNATAMTNPIVDLSNIVNDTPLNSSTQFTPSASGVYYFGFNAYSDVNQNGLFVDNINVDVFLSNDSFDNASFVAYPNPVKDVLNLSYSSEITSVKVINLLGQEVISRKVNNTTSQIDMTSLTAGAYIVNVTIGDAVKTIKVIKQ